MHKGPTLETILPGGEKSITDLREEIVQQFDAFRTRSDCDPYELLYWLGGSIASFSETLTGQAVRAMDTGSTTAYGNVKVMDNKPYLVLCGTWSYFDCEHEPPDVSAVSELIPYAHIVAYTKSDQDFTLEVSLDLDTWPNFLPYILHSKASFVLMNERAYPSARAQATADVDLLRHFFYPTLTWEVLEIAAEFGVLDSVDTCRALCGQHGLSAILGIDMPDGL